STSSRSSAPSSRRRSWSDIECRGPSAARRGNGGGQKKHQVAFLAPRRRGDRMRRREWMLLLGGAMAAARTPRPQQKAMLVIGFLTNASPDRYAALYGRDPSGLARLGYVEGQNLAIEYRWAEGNYDRLPALAADLASRKVEVIAAARGPSPTLAAKGAISIIPIVFVDGDPIGDGLVAS